MHDGPRGALRVNKLVICRPMITYFVNLVSIVLLPTTITNNFLYPLLSPKQLLIFS
jgi:hypothetical protein